MTLKISNQDARRLWLSKQGLATSPTGAIDVLSIIRDLGFVQLDTIQVVSRAHHHILWSRNQNYREPMLNIALAQDRVIFEHFTHDASVIPMEFLPMWQRQFARKRTQMGAAGWFKGLPDAKGRAVIKERIAREGALSTHAFDTKVAGAKKKMWARPPHKLALDFMWYVGELATCHRENFVKFYDLAERVYPEHLHGQGMQDDAQLDWLCRAALGRIGVGSVSEIQKFWDAASAKEVREWSKSVASSLQNVSVQAADGTWHAALAPHDIETDLKALGPATSRLRILNPFDPAIRDRQRLKRLFGFDFRVEMFVPAAQRQWGYYVYPLLEGDRFVGRIEAKGNRADGQLLVHNVWPEPEVRWSEKRNAKLHAELARFARLAGLDTVVWTCETPATA